MATTYYDYSGGSYDTGRLRTEIIAAGLPAPVDIQGSGYPAPGQPATAIRVGFDPDISPAQKTTLDGVVAAHVGTPRRRRKPYDLFLAIAALTGAQKTAIATDLFGGSPPLYTQDEGEDSADLLVLWVLNQTGLSAADKTNVKIAAAAIYARDNPVYLVNPAFDPSISVPGDEPIP